MSDLTIYRRSYGHTPAARLAHFRTRAEKHCISWRTVRGRYAAISRSWPGNWPTDTIQQKPGTPYHVDALPALPGRYVGTVSDILPRANLGYYADHWQDETITGHVLQLPARHGAPRYYPAISWSNSDMATGYPFDWYDCKEEAARAADYHAEKAAELDREANAQFQAEQDIVEAQDDIRAAREAVRAIVADLKTGQTLPPAICSTVRAAIANYREDIHDRIQTIRTRRADYWTAVTY